jgi:hypothetical protein
MRHGGQIDELRDTEGFIRERDGIIKLIEELGLMAITRKRKIYEK